MKTKPQLRTVMLSFKMKRRRTPMARTMMAKSWSQKQLMQMRRKMIMRNRR